MLRHSLSHSASRLLLAGLLLGAAGAAQAADCDPTKACCGGGTPGGATCGGDGAASQGNNSGTNQGAGNPINVITGNKFQQETDLPALPGVLGLEIVRYYNSQYSLAAGGKGLLGRGWKLSYETELQDLGNSLRIVQADGTPIVFHRGLLEPDRYLSGDARQGSLRRSVSNGRASYAWTWANGRVLAFDAGGRLERISAPTGETVSLAYDPHGWLIRVTDPQGRSLVLNHLDRRTAAGHARYAGVQSIDSPAGRFDYAYGTAPAKGNKADPNAALANLARVELPAGGADRISRSYHYEDPRFPSLLTGISVEGAGSDGRRVDRRISTWAYDAAGQGILSVKGEAAAGEAGLERVAFDRRKPGVTVLTNSLGQTTTYRYATLAGQSRLLEVRGAGCATCGPSNRRYGYDAQGRLTEETRLDDAGQPIETVRTELDAYGRPSRVSRIAYRHGKPLPAQWLRRYEYAQSRGTGLAMLQPTLIAEPSVIAGREHQLRFEYNAAGQPTRVSETGFSPLAAGTPADDLTRMLRRPSPLSRSTVYRYRIVNHRSVLSEVDGPLPNGPKADPSDSDITRIEYDARADFITAVTHPQQLRETFRHGGAAARLVERTATDGVATRLEYDFAGRVARVERAGMVVSQLHDALGRATALADAAGRAIRLDYDLAGHPLRVTDAQGYASGFTLDGEGKVLATGLYEPGQAQPLRASYTRYDAHNRPEWRLAADGRISRWRYDVRGEPSDRLDGDEVLHRTRENAAGTLRARFDLARDGQMRVELHRKPEGEDAGAVAGNALRDDFGRRLVVQLPDHGVKMARYDLADRLLEQVQADGSRIEYRYDAAGRLILKAERPASAAGGKAAGPRSTTTLRYRGAQLVEVRDPAQLTEYAFDDAGRLAATTVSLLGADGRPVARYATATRYDARTGQPSSQTLADGRELEIGRDPATQAARSITLRGALASRLHVLAAALPGWMQGLQRMIPSTEVATGIRFHPFDGIGGYRQGNGVETAKRFDIAGRLTRIEVGTAQARVFGARYDYGVGPKIRAAHVQADGGGVLDSVYRYGGFGALEAPKAGPAPALLRTSAAGATLLPPAQTAAPARLDRLGRTVDDGRHRYGYTLDGELETVSDAAGRLLARYRYNSFGQRTSKTVYAGGKAVTQYFLWLQGKLVAEADGEGRITSQYLYLGETGGAGSGRAVPIAKLESAANPDNATHAERILFIHVDQRDTPVAMTDQDRKVVWQATLAPAGQAAVRARGAVLNLRLPGQYYDAETGLHDNWHRSYDPRSGRYLQPDPLGYPDGPDAYLYASGDPINKMDPNGLYQIDMHYYMVFYLGLAAGLDKDVARNIALASQFVDDNKATSPVVVDKEGNLEVLTSLLTNQNALEHYHFMKDTLQKDGDIHDPHDPRNQLNNLYRAYEKEGQNDCTQQVFFGEMLHTLADTFSHASNEDRPYTGVDVGLGDGHGLYDSDPDYTFNHWGYPVLWSKTLNVFRITPQPNKGKAFAIDWNTNTNRTLAAEQAVFNELVSQTTWERSGGQNLGAIEQVLKDFNAVGETEEAVYTWEVNGQTVYSSPNDPDAKQTRTPLKKSPKHSDVDAVSKTFARKLAILNQAIKDLGFGDIDLTTAEWGYAEKTAEKNRNTGLTGLKCEDYPGTILPAGVCAIPQKG